MIEDFLFIVIFLFISTGISDRQKIKRRMDSCDFLITNQTKDSSYEWNLLLNKSYNQKDINKKTETLII